MWTWPGTAPLQQTPAGKAAAGYARHQHFNTSCLPLQTALQFLTAANTAAITAANTAAITAAHAQLVAPLWPGQHRPWQLRIGFVAAEARNKRQLRTRTLVEGDMPQVSVAVLTRGRQDLIGHTTDAVAEQVQHSFLYEGKLRLPTPFRLSPRFVANVDRTIAVAKVAGQLSSGLRETTPRHFTQAIALTTPKQ
jgi:hypothetical protein